MAGLNCATPSLHRVAAASRAASTSTSRSPDARVPEAMRLLAADGIVAGETGAAGLAGCSRWPVRGAAAGARR